MIVPGPMTRQEHAVASKAVKKLGPPRRPTRTQFIYYSFVLLFSIYLWLRDFHTLLYIFLCTIAFIRGIIYLRRKLALRKHLARFLEESKKSVFDLDAAGFTTGSNEHFRLHVKWTGILRRIEIDDALLFLPQPRFFYRIPKHGLTPQDLSMLRGWTYNISTDPFPPGFKLDAALLARSQALSQPAPPPPPPPLYPPSNPPVG